MQDVHQPRRVTAVQSDGGLVQHVERAHQPRAQQSRELNALGFAAAQSRGQAVKRQVFQANIVQEFQPLLDLLQDSSRDLRLLARELEVGNELRRGLNGHRRELADVLAFNLYLQRVRPQPPAAALRTLRISSIPAQKHPHMQLVFLALQHGKEALDTGKFVFTFNHPLLLLRFHLIPRQVQRDPGRPGKLPQLALKGAILGLGPGLNRAFAQRFGYVGDDKVQIKINGVAKALAARAGAVRIVEGKQPRLRLFIPDVATLALEFLREAPLLRLLAFAWGAFEYSFSGFAITGFYSVHDARPLIGANHNAVGQHVDGLGEVD